MTFPFDPAGQDDLPANSSGLLSRRSLLKSAAMGAAAMTLPHVGAAAAAAGENAIDRELPALPKDTITAVSPSKVLAFDLADVRLLPSAFLEAQKRDAAYLLFLEPDRLLHNFRVNAGLTPKAPIYGGWESLGVAGHIGGHYLSACSLMYRATGDRRFRDRVEYMVGDLALCQGADGLVTAIPDAKSIFARVAQDGSLSGWVPWYTMHKLFAGLRDSYRYCGNEQAKAVFLKLTDWAQATTHNLTDEQFQAMLNTEHGGMVETISDAYAMTGDTRYRDFARRFTHHAVFDPLAARTDNLDGLHSNTQIPKMIGYERFYELTGETPYHVAPNFFWETVTQRRSYANGGNGDYEHFFPVADFHYHVQSDFATETCCTYNMLKLTKSQYQQDPAMIYADYYEKAMLNNILASQEKQGLMIYHTPMKPGHFKVYGDPVNAFWCCTGTGMENHSRYGESIYFMGADGNSVYVNLYVPSVANWRQKGMTLRLDGNFPEETASRLSITCAKPTRAAVKFRSPYWTDGFQLKLNGKEVATTGLAGKYVTVDRTWRSGDLVEISYPMKIRTEQLPNTPQKQAFFYGPVLLASALGTDGMDKTPDICTSQAPYDNLPALKVSSIVTDDKHIGDKVQQAGALPMTFRTVGIGVPEDITLVPLYRLNHQRQNIYWDVYTPGEYKARVTDVEEKQRALDARTVDHFLPGSQQSEVDHNLVGTNSRTGAFAGGNWRDAFDGGQFSFVMKVDPGVNCLLRCTFWGSDTGGRVFDILIDKTTIATQTLDNNKPGELFDVDYPIDKALTNGKTTVTVTIMAHSGQMAGGLFDCRMLRASPLSPVIN